jgi:uncharacterized membrane protein YiaA
VVQVPLFPPYLFLHAQPLTYTKGGGKLRKKRNTLAFTFLSWASFVLSFLFFLVAIWNTEWQLVEKGFYGGVYIWSVYSAFVLSKVIRDNDDDKEDGITQNFSFRNKEDK